MKQIQLRQQQAKSTIDILTDLAKEHHVPIDAMTLSYDLVEDMMRVGIKLGNKSKKFKLKYQAKHTVDLLSDAAKRHHVRIDAMTLSYDLRRNIIRVGIKIGIRSRQVEVINIF